MRFCVAGLAPLPYSPPAMRATAVARITPLTPPTDAAAARISLPDGSWVERHGDAAEIRDPAGRLLVRYERGSATVSVPEGDLCLEAPNGSVRLRSGADVDIEAAGTLRQRATQLSTKVERYELEATRIVEKARDAFRDVSGYARQRIGRLSTVVRDLYTVQSQRTVMRSHKDTSIDGRRIRLG